MDSERACYCVLNIQFFMSVNIVHNNFYKFKIINLWYPQVSVHRNTNVKASKFKSYSQNLLFNLHECIQHFLRLRTRCGGDEEKVSKHSRRQGK